MKDVRGVDLSGFESRRSTPTQAMVLVSMASLSGNVVGGAVDKGVRQMQQNQPQANDSIRHVV
eukprot:2738115-Amphidinium_carterae.1